MIKLRPTAVQTGIWGIGTAKPNTISQQDLTDLAEHNCAQESGQRAWLRRVFTKCGVGRRASVLQTEQASMATFYPPRKSLDDRGPTTAERMQRYALEAPKVAADAAANALTNAATAASEITHLIGVSCTGFVAPGLDVELIDRLGLRPDVQRTQIGFMGCHAALNALAAARNIVRGDPQAIVLVCCVELCSLHFAYGFDPQRIVANALFGDGAAAAVVREGAPPSDVAGWRLHSPASLLVPGTRDAMTWRIGDHGFEMTLSTEVPALVEARLRDWCAGWLAEQDVTLDQIALWAVHPGGPKVLDAAANALALPADALRWSRQVLHEQGNLSSTTLLHILTQMARDDVRGKCVALGFGPGLMMEGFLLER